MSTVEPRMYGYFRKPRSYGMGNLGMVGALLVITACVTCICLNFFVSWQSALVAAAVSVVVLGTMSYKDRHDLSVLQKAGTRIAYTKAKSKGETLYRSGPLTKYGATTLPGLLASSVVTEHLDAEHRPFALVQYPKTNQWAITIKCNPDGSSLQDQFHVDTQVKSWGEYMDFLAHEPACIQAQATIQTSPTSGPAVQREISSQMSSSAPSLAKQFGAQVTSKYQEVGTPHIDAWLTLTFAGFTSKKKRNAESMANLLATRLPILTQKLSSTGAGNSIPVDGQTLVHIVASAYNPEYIKALTDADARGIARSQMVLKWDSAGPLAADDNYSNYVHDSGVSVVWAKTDILGDVTEESLEPLLEPHPKIDVKRVAILYKPMSPDHAAPTAQADKRNARRKVTRSNNPTERSMEDLTATQVVAGDQVRGAALVNFAIVYSATVFDKARQEDAESAIDAASPTARIQHRRLRGSQAAGFAQSLPVGIIMTDMVSVPTAIREGL